MSIDEHQKRAGIDQLTDREKQTLRLLLRAHDAKSIAGALGLSVHTINERLRDARGKLGVSSSREAARLLASAEAGDEKLGDNALGVAEPASAATIEAPRPRRLRRAVWIGAALMSMLVASVALVAALNADRPHSAGTLPVADAVAPDKADPAALDAARRWAQLLDAGRWHESWTQAGALFRSQLSAASWKAMIVPVREPLGAVGMRVPAGAQHSTAMPGAPAGDYWVFQFATRFAARADAVETITVVREADQWKVVGYFIR